MSLLPSVCFFAASSPPSLPYHTCIIPALHLCFLNSHRDENGLLGGTVMLSGMSVDIPSMSVDFHVEGERERRWSKECPSFARPISPKLGGRRYFGF